ncbi:MAG: CBS domain-containing protein [Methanosarcinales archaeon]|nr:MAG: CBS domain-containing protein [Methanosarcinales archaeon]
MKLTTTQVEILTTLISLFRRKGGAVKGDELAVMINRTSGTVRNHMQALRALGMVESVPGPKGGYRPTSQTYDTLHITNLPGMTKTNIYRNGKIVKDVTACEISFTTVQDPKTCNGRVKVLGDIRKFHDGDIIKIGPTPNNKLVIRGKVIGRDDTRNILVYAISEVITLPKRRIREWVSNNRATVEVDNTVKVAADTLLKHEIAGAPVMDNNTIVGIVMLTDIIRALIAGSINQKVWNIMSGDAISIDGDASISSVAKLFDQHQVNNIVVVVNGKPYGVVSKKDIPQDRITIGESIIAPTMSA